MDKQDQLEELLVDWRLQRQQGKELSAEELCKDSPEFVPELSKMISQLKEMDWLEEDDDSDDDFLHLPDFSTVTNRADDTRLPASGITLDQFCQRLMESGLMDADDVAKYRKLYPATDAVSFAQQLVKGKKLTRFQATVLLEGRDLPLVLDRYVILDELGAGGMGAVYKALHQQMDRVVALKILPKSVVDSSEKIKRFQREVKAAAKLHHQNIVVAHDATESKGTHFLVMEMVDGQDLAKLVRKNGPFSVAKTVHYITQTARGLEHAHGMGIVHRDIKPANLLLDRKGVVKILDMGLARIESSEPETEHTVSQELTQAGMVMGTIAYLAPEQALDTRHADARSDIYSLGCTLYFLLTGKVPYHEDTMMKTIMAHREGAIPSLCDARQGVPAELDAIFQKMVAKQPADRFQSMTELLSALERLVIKDEVGQQPVVAGSEAMHNTATFIDTSRAFAEPTLIVSGRKKPPKRFWPVVTASLLGIIGIAWAASILLKVETTAGTIVLEIDQPELAGAEVSVDGQKRITIKTGEGMEPIQVEADEKSHTLKVTKGGFEAFVTTFTVKAGKEQAIKVRLEPLQSDSSPPVVAQPTDPNWALKFDGENSEVYVPTFQYDGTHPITMECRVKALTKPLTSHPDQFLLSMASYPTLLFVGGSTYTASGHSVDETGRATAYRLFSEHKRLHKHVHVALVYDEYSLQMYVNGKKASTSFEAISEKTKSWMEDSDGKFDTPYPLVKSKTHGLSIGSVLPSAKEDIRHNTRYSGIVDELRISNIARYTEDYIPKDRLEADEHTMALYHFDEGQGDTAEDLSGHRHHGKITAAKWVRVDDKLNVIETSPAPAEASPYIWPQDQPAPAIAPFTPEEAREYQEAWAKHLGVPVEMDNSIGMKFRVIPPGEFLMGSREEEIANLLEKAKEQELPDWYMDLKPSEVPQHKVTLPRPFSLSIHEVTRGQFGQFVEATGYKTEAEQDGKGGSGYKNGQWVTSPEFLWDTKLGFETEQTKDHPVVNVSWNDAMAFCEWLSEKEGVTYRLPREAEWEFVCRAGNQGRYSFGEDDSKLADYAWCDLQGGRNTMPVGTKAPNPFGLFDLYGNVWEWCADSRRDYNTAHTIDPIGTNEVTSRVLRGGAFDNHPVHVGSANRMSFKPYLRSLTNGFRPVRAFEKYEPKEPNAERPNVDPKSNDQ